MSYSIYSVFGNQVRNKLILCLSDRQKNVSDLISTCGLAQSAVSQHLSKLKKSGIVSSHKSGKEVYYFLRYGKAVEISRLLRSLEQEVL